MEENQYAKIHRYIDQMPMVCNWEMDTVVFAVGGIFSVFLLDGWAGIGGFLIGSSLAYINEKMKNNKYRNYLKHVFYIYGFVKPKTGRLPHSYKKYFLA
jgi:type IV conjugative transfer system protein TraL